MMNRDVRKSRSKRQSTLVARTMVEEELRFLNRLLGQRPKCIPQAHTVTLMNSFTNGDRVGFQAPEGGCWKASWCCAFTNRPSVWPPTTATSETSRPARRVALDLNLGNEYGREDILSQAYEYPINRFADPADGKAGKFCTTGFGVALMIHIGKVPSGEPILAFVSKLIKVRQSVRDNA
ncbi:MAG TPA: hypothetical protein PLH54_03775 [Syntrophales bacterium]|nr:hypothetical protein [Syntrophales bacterium]